MLTVPLATSAAATACSTWRIPGPLELVRAGTGVVFRGNGYAVRVADHGLGPDWVEREVALARLAASHGVPVGRAADLPVVATPSGTVSAWHWLATTEGHVPLGQLATAAARLHRVPTGQAEAIDPLRKVRLYLQAATTHGLADRGLLEACGALATELGVQFAELLDTCSLVVVHGDLNRGNVLATASGPVLIDLEDGGVGPVEWDLMAQTTAVRYYGDPDHTLRSLAAAFGTDASGPVYEGCVRVRTLLSALWATTGILRGPAFTRSEADTRLRTAVDGAAPRRWARI